MKRKESNFNGLLKREGHKLSKTDEIQHPQFPPSGLCISGTRVIIIFLISPACNTFEQVKHTRNACSTKKTDCTLKTTGRVTNAELSCTRGQPDVYGPAEDWNSHFPLDTRTSLFPVLHTLEASLCWGIQNYQGSGLAERLRSMKNPTPFCSFSSTAMPAQIRELRNRSSSQWELSDAIKHCHSYCTIKRQIKLST